MQNRQSCYSKSQLKSLSYIFLNDSIIRKCFIKIAVVCEKTMIGVSYTPLNDMIIMRIKMTCPGSFALEIPPEP